MGWFETSGVHQVKYEIGFSTDSKVRLKKGRSGMVGGRFDKQGNLLTRLVWVATR